MKALLDEIMSCIKHELERAAMKFGMTNHSDHESYAILAEELEEAIAEAKAAGKELDNFWDLVKCNGSDAAKLNSLKTLERCASLAACEFTQVAAMARKAALTVGDRTVFIDLVKEGEGR